jgi:hypothetical protein
LCTVPRLGHVEADGEHALLEELAVLALVDGLGLGADHLDAVFFEDAGLVELHRGVERGLAAERGSSAPDVPSPAMIFSSTRA